MNKHDRILVILGVIGLVLIGWLMGFAIFAGLTWLVCWAFDLTFSWKYAFGVWVIYIILRQLFVIKSA